MIAFCNSKYLPISLHKEKVNIFFFHVVGLWERCLWWAVVSSQRNLQTISK